MRATEERASIQLNTLSLRKLALICVLSLVTPLCALAGDFWQQTGTENLRTGVGAPSPRSAGPASFNGRYIFVWGGSNGSGGFDTGGSYDVVMDTWMPLTNLNSGLGAPDGRCCCIAVWTPSGYVVWGGYSDASTTPKDGGLYDIATDTWLPRPVLSQGSSLPTGSYNGFGVWTGSAILIRGGFRIFPSPSNFTIHESVQWGALYDPVADLWTLPPVLGTVPPYPHLFHEGSVWTGSQLISRSGLSILPQYTGLTTVGGVYDLKSDTWLARPTLNSFSGHPNSAFFATWTGLHRLEWGGISPIQSQPPFQGEEFYARGLGYDPRSDQFLNLPALDSPAPIERRVGAAVVWTGAHMLTYGGQGQPVSGIQGPMIPANNALYSPGADSWLVPVGLNDPNIRPVGVVSNPVVWTGDRLVTLFGHNSVGGINTGGVYHPPRVAPTVRNLSAGDAGASASNPLVVTVGEKFRHRIVCYGCPEAALVPTTQLPAWLNIGWGGPTQLVAHGTGAQAPGGIGQPFSPWFSAEGLTCDGQWLQGTPTAADIGLQSFTFFAHNGVAPDTQTYTVWLEVIGSPVFTSFPPPTTATAGESYSHSVTAVGNPTPVVTLSGLPTWLSYSNGMLAGTPPISAGGTIQGPFTLSASNGQPPAATQLFSVQVAHAYTDTNRDRAVNVTDVQLTVNIILGLAQKQWPEQGDADRNSVVNVVDVQRVVNKILNP